MPLSFFVHATSGKVYKKLRTDVDAAVHGTCSRAATVYEAATSYLSAVWTDTSVLANDFCTGAAAWLVKFTLRWGRRKGRKRLRCVCL